MNVYLSRIMTALIVFISLTTGIMAKRATETKIKCQALCGDCYDTGGAGIRCSHVHSIVGLGYTVREAYMEMTDQCPGTLSNNSAVGNYFFNTPGSAPQQLNSNYLDQNTQIVCHITE